MLTILVSAVHDQGYLAGNPSDFVAALDAFRFPVTPAVVRQLVPSMSPLVVTDVM